MVKLKREHVDAIAAHALETPREETCGVLGGRDGQVEVLHRAKNAAEPEARHTRFEMDSRDMFRAIRDIEDTDLDLIGFYHSHTHTQAYPSPTDVAMWQSTWTTSALCFICSLMEPDRPSLRAFVISADGKIAEEAIEIE